jgi:hypothetical protein
MSINFNKFVPRPGLVNKQGRLPDPYELVCIQVPKIFDQCLIKRCLVYGSGPDTNTTDCELRSNPLVDPKSYIRSRDFNITLNSVDKFSLRADPNYKKLILHYTISFYVDYTDCDNVNRSEFFEINRKDVIYKFYCPDSIAQISAYDDTPPAQDLDSSIVKLEVVAETLNAEFIRDDGEWYLDITLGYFLIVKSELHVQLLVPAYGYCPVPEDMCCQEISPDEDPCIRFWNSPPPQFYPDQVLEPLFPEKGNARYPLDSSENEYEDNCNDDYSKCDN